MTDAGLDWGGVSREFFERLCVELFDASNLLFRRFNEDNPQALVSPSEVHHVYNILHRTIVLLLKLEVHVHVHNMHVLCSRYIVMWNSYMYLLVGSGILAIWQLML